MRLVELVNFFIYVCSPKSTEMKKILPMLVLFGCTNEAIELPSNECFCEKVIYLEEKYQDEADSTWRINRIEIDRLAVDCQSETDFIPTGGILECFRIECN